MICPHCNIGVSMDFEEGFTGVEEESVDSGYEIAIDQCPECDKLIVILRRGRVSSGGLGRTMEVIKSETLIYPAYDTYAVAPEVPQKYQTDFLEASQVLRISPKASAALSRRLLQRILREEFQIHAKDLFQEIDQFIARKDTPGYLAEAVDAIRNVGNFAAHPLKSSNTGEIVDVEPGEADWLLEVLDSLFDYTFVQPMRLEKRRQALNAKLQSLGKPPMKGTPKSLP
jgi:hypothetical protein